MQVSAITIVISDPFYEIQQRIAVSEEYICYSLKAGQIRALHKSTGRRALLKSSSAPPDIRSMMNLQTVTHAAPDLCCLLSRKLTSLTDHLTKCRFASNTANKLASADLQGNVYIWDIELEDRDDQKLTETLLAHFTFAGNSGQFVTMMRLLLCYAC